MLKAKEHLQQQTNTHNAHSQQHSDTYISPQEAAKILGVATWTLARWANQGIVKSVRLQPSSPRRYLREEIENIAKNGAGNGKQ